MPKLAHSFLFAAAIAFAAPGCASLGNLSPSQRVQDASNDLTTAAHFGRMDVALELVHQTSRDQFTRQHAAWGSGVRIVDCDLVALRMPDKEHGDVSVNISWQRIDDSEMHSTQLVQHWQDHRGHWLLEGEERTRGDVGLLGEPTTIVRPAPSRLQFETITIR